MEIRNLYATQKRIRRRRSISDVIRAYRNEETIEPVELGIAEDGKIQVMNGHHRLFAYLTIGKTILEDYEYRLNLANYKPRVGTMIDFFWRNI